MAVNVKALFYCGLPLFIAYLHALTLRFGSNCCVSIQKMAFPKLLPYYRTARLTDLLAKDSTPEDPARVINVSSNASFSAHADDSAMGNRGNGVWACKNVALHALVPPHG